MEGQPWGLGQWWYIELAWGWDVIIGCWSRRPGAFNCSSTVTQPTPPPLSTALFWPIITVGSKRTLSLSACLGVAGCSTAGARSGCPPGLGEVGLWSTFAFFVCRRIASWISASVPLRFLVFFWRAVQRQFRGGRNCNLICKFGSFVQD